MRLGVNEAVSFDVKKTLNLVKKDKFLKYVVKKDFRGKIDAITLQKIFVAYIKGDKRLEKLYKSI